MVAVAKSVVGQVDERTGKEARCRIGMRCVVAWRLGGVGESVVMVDSGSDGQSLRRIGGP